MTIHGALVEVAGVGVLLLGPSGAGKSECALELLGRGHRLVADDRVVLEVREGRLLGRAPASIRHAIEIRGLGLLYVPDLFGEDRVAEEAEVELACRLERWRPDLDLERVGFEREQIELEGVTVACVTLPARPGGSLATIVEVAARDHENRRRGRNPAQRLDEQVRREMARR